ncbi:MAG TPA: amino acid permease [Flavobacteriales bacterium]|nr:amino acid permease [Flavobacteriales bacterium]
MQGLQRRFGLNTTIAIIVGTVIGSGIFMKPALMASQLGSPLLLLSVWVVAGVVSLFGAMSNAELAALYPDTGGPYVYFREIYGGAFAFLYGWAAFTVFNCAGTVSIAYVFVHYGTAFVDLPQLTDATIHSLVLRLPGIGTILPLENISEKLLTVLVLFLLTLLNYFSAGLGGAVQRALTLLKALAIGILIVGLLAGGGTGGHDMFAATQDAPKGMALLAAYFAALGGAFWAYDGWNNISFIAGEVKDPQRNIPRGLFIGLSFCILVYVLVNLAFLYVLPFDAMAASKLVASDAARAVWGALGGGLVAAMVMLSTLGSTNANVLATARVTYAVGAQYKGLAWVGNVRPGSQTPGNALLLNMMWMAILVFSGSFDMLTDMVVFVSWFYYAMLALGVIILRVRRRDVDRPYRVQGYPWVPGSFVLFTFAFLVITVWSDVADYVAGRTVLINSLLGLLITLAGLPLYFMLKRGTRSSES